MPCELFLTRPRRQSPREKRTHLRMFREWLRERVKGKAAAWGWRGLGEGEVWALELERSIRF